MSKNIKNSPFKIISGAITALANYDWGGKRKQGIADAQNEHDVMKRKWQGLDRSNLYSDVTNPYANMQNTMEDLTVNQQQAQFVAQQGAQTRANVMQNMRGAAGSSGIAGLAQAMANQGQQAAQQASASIGQQEASNQRAAAQQAGQMQTMERQGDWKANMTRLAGEEQSRQMVGDQVRAEYAMSQNKLSTAKSQHELAQEQMWGGVTSAINPLDNLEI